MESNNQHLGEGTGDTMPNTEHTPTDEQPTPPVDVIPQIDDVPEAELETAAAMDDATTATQPVEETATPESAASEADALDTDALDTDALDMGVDEGDLFEEDDLADEEEPEEDLGPAGPTIKRGDIVDGTVHETSPTEVLVELEDGLVGVIANRELERMDRAALEALQVGSPVSAFVLKARGSDGRPVLSLARAEEESNWRMAESYHQSQEVYFSKVAGYNKGGLIVRFGKVRGFVPASQVGRERQQRASGNSPEERWGSMVGDEIAVKVVEIDRGRNRLILSERAAAREWREQQKSRLLESLAEGEVRRGKVISIADFGAFVDLGGADGLVHLTELSWQHITHPREVVEVGQEVEVQIINIDRQRKRIGLSMKRREDDPWLSVMRNYRRNQLVQATVTKLTKFGAFARLVDAPEIEGLIHISELADYRVSHPREVVLVGDVLTLRIVKIDPDQRRLGLSLRKVDSAQYMDQDLQAFADDMFPSLDDEPTEPAASDEYQADDDNSYDYDDDYDDED